MSIRNEEFTTLGDFILPTLTRDLSVFTARYPKYDLTFLHDFEAKLNHVKSLESTLLITETQKSATESLYTESSALNAELSFLADYFKDAGLNKSIVSDLKKDLVSHNIEGAVLKIEGVIQFITANQVVLEEQGMAADFGVQLGVHKTSLSEKNAAQNIAMNKRKELVELNKSHYDGLYKYIVMITDRGKKLFKDSVVKDEYSITKLLQKMRSGGRPPAPIV